MSGSGYHKALFAASNPDAIANHFYEQGKADAIKQISQTLKILIWIRRNFGHMLSLAE